MRFGLKNLEEGGVSAPFERLAENSTLTKAQPKRAENCEWKNKQ